VTSACFETQSLPSLFRCHPYSFTFYLRKPFSSIHVFLSDMRRTLFLFVLCGFLMSSGAAQAADGMNAVAEQYVHLVLALGQHDPDYVDAFYGPAEWKTQAEKEKKSLDAIGAEAAELSATLTKTPEAATSRDELLRLRREYLKKQIAALAARMRMLKDGRARCGTTRPAATPTQSPS